MFLRRPGTVAVGIAILIAALAGCGDEQDPAPPGPPVEAWQQSTDPVDTDGLVWAMDRTVHLAAGATIRTEEQIGAYTVAGDGIYYTAASDGDDHTEIHLATPVEEIATGIATSGLQASPDGRYLAYVDLTTGEEDRYGTPQPNNVVLDLREGTEVVRATDGMGDPAEEDYADFLGEGGAELETVTDDTAYFLSGGTVYAYDLATGEATTVDRSQIPGETEEEQLWNPDHSWRIVKGNDRLQDTFRSEDGIEVVPRVPTPRWAVFHWLDDDTALGNAFGGQGAEVAPDDPITLMTCTVPSGECTLVEGSRSTLAGGSGPLLPVGLA